MYTRDRQVRIVKLIKDYNVGADTLAAVLARHGITVRGIFDKVPSSVRAILDNELGRPENTR